MTKKTHTVWVDSENRDLLVKRGDGEFYIPLSTCNKETIRELAAACYDATKTEEPAQPVPASAN